MIWAPRATSHPHCAQEKTPANQALVQNFLGERVAASVAAALSSGQDPGVEALNLLFKKYQLKQIA
jgi:hypothetical protein